MAEPPPHPHGPLTPNPFGIAPVKATTTTTMLVHRWFKGS